MKSRVDVPRMPIIDSTLTADQSCHSEHQETSIHNNTIDTAPRYHQSRLIPLHITASGPNMDIDRDDDLSSLLATYDTAPSTPSDLARLQTLWQAELASPELLPYPGELLERVMNRVREQLDLLEQLGAELQDAKTGFRSVVIQTELERVKWLVRVYVRTRIRKVSM